MSVADRLAALSPQQRALFETLRSQAPPPQPAGLVPPPVRPVSGPQGLGDWPLSYDQERLWRLHQAIPGLVSWNVDAGSRVQGTLRLPVFVAAVHQLVRRHAAWRTTFPEVDGRPVQRVAAFLAPAAALIDLSGLPAARREAIAHQAVRGHTRQPFDLARGPLLRMALVRLAEREHLYLLTVHHLVTDWVSFQIFFGELMAAYQARCAGREAELPGLPVQYPDYAVWEREWLRGEALAAEQAYWRRALEGFPTALDLPAARPRPAVQSQRGGWLRVAAGAERSARLRSLARREGATTFIAVLAVLYALLWRLSGRERLVVGSNAANRARPELQAVAGFFLTQVPFATDLGGDPSFRELLARSRCTALAAYAHQNVPFSQLIEAVLGPAPTAASADLSRNPIMQVLLLVLEAQPPPPPGEPAFEPVVFDDGNSRWDLMFGLYDDRDRGLAGALEYNADLFDRPAVEGWLALLYALIDAVTADPDLRLTQLPRATGAAP
jgi:hypothetical protein